MSNGVRASVVIALVILSSFTCISLMVPREARGEAWSYWVIYHGNHDGASLALDGAGNPHISYIGYFGNFSSPKEVVNYSTWNGASWETVVVDSDSRAEDYSALALNSTDSPVIVYHTRSWGGLILAEWNGTAWLKKQISFETSAFPSLAVDNNDVWHVAYLDFEHEDLIYSTNSAVPPGSNTIDSNGDVGWHASLALDKNEKPCIAYADLTSMSIKFAEWNGTDWQIETVDTLEKTYGETSLAFDYAGRPHISYIDEGTDFVKHAWRANGSWSSGNIDSIGALVSSTSIAVDHDNNPHIVYTGGQHSNLKYARLNGFGWDIMTIDSSEYSYIGSDRALALDADDFAHLVYTGSSGLIYANLTANNAPNKPAPPSGPDKGERDTWYNFTFSTTDPDGDRVRYIVYWDFPFMTNETAYFDSGVQVTVSLEWADCTGRVMVQAVDEHMSYSEVSEPHIISLCPDIHHDDSPSFIGSAAFWAVVAAVILAVVAVVAYLWRAKSKKSGNRQPADEQEQPPAN